MVVLLALFTFAFTTRTNHSAECRQKACSQQADSHVTTTGADAGNVPLWKNVVTRPAATREELIDQIYQVTENAPGFYGVYIHELDTGQGFGINADARFIAASTNKIPILIKLYKEVELGNISPDQVMTYSWSDFEGGTGTIQTTGVGTQWTVAQLAGKMIKESDNIAKNMLLRLLGYSQVETFARGLGSDFDLYYNQTSPQGMAVLLRLIYENGIVGPELSQEMVGLMIETEFEDRLPRYLDDVAVANKIGSWEDSFSDVGIVLHQERPFVICVYSSGTGSEAAAAEAIALIAAHTYAYEVSR
jgi:beta-lactamase class A